MEDVLYEKAFLKEENSASAYTDVEGDTGIRLQESPGSQRALPCAELCGELTKTF